MSRAGLLFGLLLIASCKGSAPIEPVVNHCSAAFGCATGDVCDEKLGLCVHASVARPYDFVVQVITGGRGLVTRTWNAQRTLVAEPELGPITIRKAVRVQGKVFSKRSPTEMPGPLQAELAFFPRRAEKYLSTAQSEFTHLEGSEHVFTALLDPNTIYDVRVFPLGREDSSKHPPHSFILDTANLPMPLVLNYPEIVAFSGRLAQEMPLPAGAISRLKGLKVRLRNKATLEFTSSVTELNDMGDYELFIAPETQALLADHELVVDLLRNGQPWVATLAIDGARLTSNRTIPIPNIPDLVSLRVGLELGPGLESQTVPSADVTFVSDFQPPPDKPFQAERDWCRLRASSSLTYIKCSVRMTTSIGGGANPNSVALLPGYYKIFVAPNDNLLRPVSSFVESILPQPGGLEQGPVSYTLIKTDLYTGKTVSPFGEAMPFVTVTAKALNISDNEEQGEAAAYNRTAETVSDAAGEYSLAVDLGSYDLLAMAPEETGFPWYCWPNRRLTGESVDDFPILMSSPVVAQGRVVDEQGSPIYAARVEAFALVDDEIGKRAVRIARTESSDAGTFALLLPMTIDHDPLPVTGVDGGAALRSIDAGLPER